MLLGDILIESGVLTSKHIEHARARKSKEGGRLGTNLLELGFVTHDQLALALGKQLGVPATLTKHFQQIDSRALSLLSSTSASKWVALPFAFAKSAQGRRLVVCFRDPKDTSLVQSVSNETGVAVVPVVAPERSLHIMISRCYKIRPPTRFHTESEATDVDMSMDGDEDESNSHGLQLAMLDDDFVEKTAPEVMFSRSGSQFQMAAVAKSEAAPEAKTAQNSTSIPPSKIQSPPTPSEHSLSETIAAIHKAQKRSEISNSILDFLSSRCDAALFLQIKKDLALGYRGCGPHLTSQSVESIVLPLSQESLIADAVSLKEMYIGPQNTIPSLIEERFLKLFGSEASHCAVVPIVIGQRVVMAIYIHGNELDHLTADLKSLQSATARAFTRLIHAARK